MTNFNNNSVFNLKPIAAAEIIPEVFNLLIPGESVVSAFKTLRDQLIFTSKRIIAVDVQGIGRKREFTSMPYNRVQYFSVQTPGVMEMVPDSELTLVFTNGFMATFEFRGNVDIGAIGRMISGFVLK